MTTLRFLIVFAALTVPFAAFGEPVETEIANVSAELAELLTVVNSRPNASMVIEGHTEVRGDDAYNQALSQRRAESVQIWPAAASQRTGLRPSVRASRVRCPRAAPRPTTRRTAGSKSGSRDPG